MKRTLARRQATAVRDDGFQRLFRKPSAQGSPPPLRLNAKAKTIVVTGFVTDAQKRAAMAAGAAEFLAKPFTIEKLLTTLRTILR